MSDQSLLNFTLDGVNVVGGKHGNVLLTNVIFTIKNSKISNGNCPIGSTFHAGGLNIFRSRGTVKNTLISDNELNDASESNVKVGGGGVYSYLSEVAFYNVDILRNKVTTIKGGYGAGIFARWSDVKIHKSEISGNVIVSDQVGLFGGAGLATYVSEVEVIGTEFTNNQVFQRNKSANACGGGVFVEVFDPSAESLLINSVLFRENYILNGSPDSYDGKVLNDFCYLDTHGNILKAPTQ